MMQIKANITRMKYRSVCSELKEKSVLYASSLKNLEDGIKQQENEIKRLQARLMRKVTDNNAKKKFDVAFISFNTTINCRE